MDIAELLADWQKEYRFNAFISDGIVDEQCYEEPHILFILRDMNCQTSCDLRRILRETGSNGKTWNNVARWTSALLDGGMPYPAAISHDERIRQLKRVAVMNLKKEGGGARANGKELAYAVRQQRARIFAEISLCEPSVIICCGLTSGNILGNAALLWAYNVLPRRSGWMSFISETLGCQWWYFYTEINGRRVPVISFCHPQVSVLGCVRGHKELFEPLYRDMLAVRQMFLG